MKKFTLLFIINLSIFGSLPFGEGWGGACQAQYVTIPDANFVTWLTTNYPSCMNGNQMDTTCSAIVNATSVICYNNNIHNLSGIEYFDNLNTLFCGMNQLNSLPTLLNTLTQLSCGNNPLASLPTLPNSLIYLNCDYNQLTNIPPLPNSLYYLSCDYNQLASLPSLPSSLNYLISVGNPLTSLPVLPDSLYELDFSESQLTSLPTLPNSLANLSCQNNLLTSLPALPNSLIILECYINQISSLPLLPNSLQKLSCYDNQLTSLPILPNSLTDLNCHHNQLTTLPTLPNSLLGLYCHYNQLSNLPSLPSALQYLNCNTNQLSSLPQAPNVMQYFNIKSNNISCLVNLPIGISIGWADISNNPLTCVPNQTNYSLGLPLCTDNDPINNPNNCQSVANIVGNVYTDLNSNCTYNNTDWNTENIPVKLYDNQNNFLALSYTINGVYSFAALQPDTFKVKVNDIALPLDMACGQANNQTVHLDSANQTISNINFPVVCDSAFDMQVHAVTRQGWVFPGQVHTVKTNLANDVMWYNLNCGNSTYSGTVTINVSGPVTYVAPVVGALTPLVSGNTFTYTIADFNSLTPASFGLQLLTDTTAQAGNQICVHVTIATTPTDADTSNNTYNFCYNVVNSYDPNLKEVYPTDVLPGYNDWFTYTIHFQNTGTAPAFNIRLRDTLDTQLDLNTFEFLGASHTATTSLNGRMLSVRFNNIMLPDSTTDHNGSMGYYQYRVKPLPNLLNGSNIKNTAYIYFDYNPAIVTNTTESHFDIFTTAPSLLGRAGVGLFYPNPSKGVFTLDSPTVIKTIEVFNIMGERVLSLGSVKQINLQAFPKGIYFAKINKEFVSKLVKE